MPFAERYALPVDARLGTSIQRTNDFKELFYVRWGNIWFNVFWGHDLNLKVVLNVYRSDSICERFIVDTDPHDVQWDRHKRVTRDFYIHPFPAKSGAVTRVTFSYIAHLRDRSIPSQQEYVLFDEWHLRDGHSHHRPITMEGSRPNGYRTRELDAGELQRDVDWCNHYFESLHLTPKFTGPALSPLSSETLYSRARRCDDPQAA